MDLGRAPNGTAHVRLPLYFTPHAALPIAMAQSIIGLAFYLVTVLLRGCLALKPRRRLGFGDQRRAWLVLTFLIYAVIAFRARG